jgi:hypothetical protein
MARPRERDVIPDSGLLRARLEAACATLDAEPERIRPSDSCGRPGGLVLLPEVPTILVPDLHARGAFLSSILGWIPPNPVSAPSRALSPCVADLLKEGKINLVCLGDGINTEGNAEASRRWHAALEEYLMHWRTRLAMDEEMTFALGTMLLVMNLKIKYPTNFHFLKGNHDNLADLTDCGDRHFYKYASESAMGASWFKKTYGQDILASWREFELSLPLLALRPGSGTELNIPELNIPASSIPSGTSVAMPLSSLVASHAEPAVPLSRSDIIEYRDRAESVYALTWTDNDDSLPGSVPTTMKNLGLKDPGNSLWFTGHRSITDSVHFRADGLLVQIHNPRHDQFAYLETSAPFEPERHIIRLYGIFQSALTLDPSEV